MQHVLYYTITRKTQNQYLVGFVCSSCESARILLVTANMEQKNRTLTDKPDPREKTMLINAYKTIQSEIARRGAAGESLLNDFSIGVDLGRATVILDGIDARCPLCGRKEPWQTVLRIDEEYAKLKPENYPRAWLEISDAEAWLDEYLETNILHYREHWNNHLSVFEKMKSEKASLRQEIADLEEKVACHTDSQKLQSLQHQIDQLVQQKEKALLFSAQRTALSKELKKAKKEEATLIETINEQKKKYGARLASIKKEYETLSLSNKGIDEKIVATENENNMCWYIE